MTRFALAVTLAIAATASQARTIYPEIMSQFDMAHTGCQTGPENAAETRRACQARDRYWRQLRDAGYTLHRDPENPNGYVWR